MNDTQYNIPFATEKRQRIVDQFNRDGYYFLGQVLTVHEVSALKSVIERKYSDSRMHEEEGDHIVVVKGAATTKNRTLSLRGGAPVLGV